MPITVPGVCRFTILGNWTNGRVWANVLDYQVDTTGSTVGRDERVGELAFDIISNYQDHILPHLTNNVRVTGCRFLDLDDVEGTSGEAPPDGAHPVVGGLAGASTTPNVSYLVRKLIAGQRGLRGGRMYIPGVQEASVSEDGLLEGTGVVDLQAGLRSFLADTQNEEPAPPTGTQVWSRMVVVHFDEPRPAPPAEDNRVGTFERVHDLALDSKVATQRRRLR